MYVAGVDGTPAGHMCTLKIGVPTISDWPPDALYVRPLFLSAMS
jgi:hypothetical protein